MFITRLISGIVLLILIFIFLTLGGVPLFLLLAFVSIVGFLELTRALEINRNSKSIHLMEVLGMIGIIVLYGIQIGLEFLQAPFTASYVLGCIIFTVITMLAAAVIAYPKFEIQQIAKAVFAFMYVPVMLAFVGMTRDLPDIGIVGVWLIWFSAWGSDTCAYAGGMATKMTVGNHKAFPKLSPKKSIEGCISGVLGAAILGGLCGLYFYGKGVEVPLLALSCAIGSAVAQCGDLAASLMKRNLDIKDFGRCIPGHGGILDRFDSIIFTAPFIYFMVTLFLKLGFVS